MSNTTNAIILTDRDDRLGSNFVVKLGDFINGRINNVAILRNKKMRYKDCVFMIPFIRNSNEISQELPSNDNDKGIIYSELIRSGGGGIRGSPATPVMQLEQDLISYFGVSGLKNEFYEMISSNIGKTTKK